jgi:hypothetical protein
VPTDAGLRGLSVVLADFYGRHSREPTLDEMTRWATTYEGIAAALRARVDELRALVTATPAPEASGPRVTPRKPKPRHRGQPPLPPGAGPPARRGTFETTRLPPKPGAPTPAQVLAIRPAKPPGKVAT